MYLDLFPLLLATGSLGTMLAFFVNFHIILYKRLRYDATNKEVEVYAYRCYWQITATCILYWFLISMVWGFNLFTLAGPLAFLGVMVILVWVSSGRRYSLKHPDQASG